MPVYQRIKELCDFEGSQRKFAEKISLSSPTVSGIIKNKSGVRSETVIAILKAYPKLRPEWLLLDQGEMWHDDDYVPPVDPGKEKEDDMVDRINKLLEQRVAELEREIRRNNPDLADELGIE